jgi:tetratricopeptide (TPR) repeat protein
LVKVASVIGRNFFYKILFEVAKEIEEIDERLVYLEEVQLILERRRMGEVEYLFKHALAQEAAYDSILVKKRKELHLKVAQAIVTVFKERLQEFFGTLALHYSLGEDLNRAENYLIKAGEESLKSSASSEALHYYQEALDIYRRKCGDTVNTEKIAMLEKNIAIALFNTGHNEEAVEYFERVLAYYGVRAPKHPIAVILKFLIGFLDFIIKLEFQFLIAKKIPAQKEIDIFYLMLKKTAALAVTNPRRFFIEWTAFSKWFTKFDLTKTEYGYGAFGGCSTIFSLSGISFRLSRKMLEFSKDKINKNDVKSVLQYEFAKVMHNLVTGNWGADCYDDKLVNQALRFGEVFYIATYQALHSQISIERGSLDVKRIVDKLSEIADVYENDYAKVLKFRLRTLFLMKYRKLHDALLEADAGIDFIHKIGHRPIRFVLYSLKARIQMLLGDIKGAEDSLRNAKDLLTKDRFAPYFLCPFLTGQFIFDLCRLEEALKSNNKSELNKNSNRAFKSGKRAVKVSRKAAFDRVEIFNMMGVYYWLVGKQIKALKWWKRCIREGEHMGARLELSRAYMEIGKRLLEPESRHQVLDGISAEAYLEKAEELFKEMDLSWDLNELENVNRGNIK